MPPRCQLLSASLSLPARLLRHPQPPCRPFATSQPRATAKGGDLGSHLPKHVVPQNAPVPTYPYGPSRLFKQADKGLYGGQMIQFGNNVSRRTKTKTRRIWMPNVVSKSFYSVILKKKIKLRVTTKVVKTMEREGGLDEYLLKDKETRIQELGPTGWALRWWLMQTPEVIARMRAEAAALGLAQHVIEENWPKEPVWRRKARPMNAERQAEQEGQEVEEPAQRPSPQESYKRRLMYGVAPPKKASLYFRALEKGEVDAAGGRVAWLASLKAKQMFSDRRRSHAERAAERAERTAGKAALSLSKRVPKTTDAGAWNELVHATKKKSNSQMRS